MDQATGRICREGTRRRVPRRKALPAMPKNSAGITQRGISLIEAAAVLPVFLFLIVLVVEFGLMSLVHAGMNEAGDAIARHEMSIMSKEGSGARSEEAFRGDA